MDLLLNKYDNSFSKILNCIFGLIFFWFCFLCLFFICFSWVWSRLKYFPGTTININCQEITFYWLSFHSDYFKFIHFLIGKLNNLFFIFFLFHYLLFLNHFFFKYKWPWLIWKFIPFHFFESIFSNNLGLNDIYIIFPKAITNFTRILIEAEVFWLLIFNISCMSFFFGIFRMILLFKIINDFRITCFWNVKSSKTAGKTYFWAFLIIHWSIKGCLWWTIHFLFSFYP